MKRKMMSAAFGGIVMFLLSCILYTGWLERKLAGTSETPAAVLLNEIEQLTADESGRHPAAEQIAKLRSQIQAQSGRDAADAFRQMAVAFGGFFAFWIGLVIIYLYWKVLSPFGRLEQYAAEIAKGNLETSLPYERTNFFGEFTWAFDHMRREILKARQTQAQAVEENKTIIATLSHDIKTPIASIRAYAEGLEAHLEEGAEGRWRYLQVIMRKCDEVTSLTNDLVLHSLSELEKLEIRVETAEISALLEGILSDLEYRNLHILNRFDASYVEVDAKRLAQVIENILNNARKYAPDAVVDVWTQSEVSEHMYEIHIRDHGPGVLPEDMPFLFDKFYRGKNVENEPGSGLGLYIVSYIMRRRDGEVRLLNRTSGLEVILRLPVS